jgi:thymidine phosphorylase
MIAEALESGAAAERFGQMVAAQGGPLDFVDCYADRLPGAPILREVPCPEAGVVTAIDGFALGQAVVDLGGGRLREGDRINPTVGLSDMVGLGAVMHRGVPLARIHAANEAAADRAVAQVLAAYQLGEAAPLPPLVFKKVSA